MNAARETEKNCVWNCRWKLSHNTSFSHNLQTHQITRPTTTTAPKWRWRKKNYHNNVWASILFMIIEEWFRQHHWFMWLLFGYRFILASSFIFFSFFVDIFRMLTSGVLLPLSPQFEFIGRKCDLPPYTITHRYLHKNLIKTYLKFSIRNTREMREKNTTNQQRLSTRNHKYCHSR